MDIKEFNITVPWGHISAKSWGNSDNYPILCVHGRQDNAGSFDRLIPLLPNYFYYLCFDLPGHGRSSHYPPGIMPTYYDLMQSVNRVIDYAGWKKFIYIGHSLGGILGLHLRAIYPENITKLILLDVVDAKSTSPSAYGEWFRLHYDLSIKIESKTMTGPPPSYTYDELVSMFYKNRNIEPEAAKCLLNRCTIPTIDGKYHLTMDQRNKAIQIPLMDEHYRLNALAPKYPFPLLIIIAKDSVRAKDITNHEMLVKELKKNNYFEMVYVDGTHDVHNNTPEVVAHIIIKLLTKTQSTL